MYFFANVHTVTIIVNPRTFLFQTDKHSDSESDARVRDNLMTISKSRHSTRVFMYCVPVITLLRLTD